MAPLMGVRAFFLPSHLSIRLRDHLTDLLILREEGIAGQMNRSQPATPRPSGDSSERLWNGVKAAAPKVMEGVASKAVVELIMKAAKLVAV
ncbi:MAG: hypothetical protein HQK60_17415 [Deltaproteobacteria bacterium]|nr:hypothetical protein [Deltaproteobacteria bacterium]